MNLKQYRVTFVNLEKEFLTQFTEKKKILEPSVNDNLMIIELPVRFITLY